MPIIQPGKRPGARLAKSKVFGKKMIGGKKSGYSSLNLTPMVDMLIIIVLYLIQSFNADGEILQMMSDIQLPTITSKLQLARAPVISVSAETILVDGSRVVDTRDLTRDETWNVPALEELLREKRREIEQSHMVLRGGQGEGFNGTINLQADKGLEFGILKKVMFACNAAGFSNINFAGLTVSAPGEVESASYTPPSQR